MAIRLRRVDGVLVALCAVESDPHVSDRYLHDGVHQALADLFSANDYAAVRQPPSALRVGEGDDTYVFRAEELQALSRKFLSDWTSNGLIPGGHVPDVPQALSQNLRSAQAECEAWAAARDAGTASSSDTDAGGVSLRSGI